MISAHARIALTIILLAGTSCSTLTNVVNPQPVDPGFRSKGLLVVQLAPKPGGYENDFDREKYYPALADRIASLPGVQSVSYIHIGPLKPPEPKVALTAEGDSAAPVQAIAEIVGPACFSTLGLPLRTGRQFDSRDDSTAPPVAIVSEYLAKVLFPGSDPIGRRVDIGSDPGRRKLTIVGVAGNARLWKGQGDAPPAIYGPLLQTNSNEQQLVIRTAGDPAMLIPAVRYQIEHMGHETVRSAKPLVD